MLAGKTLTEYTNLFSPNNFKKNDFKMYYEQHLKIGVNEVINNTRKYVPN